MDYLLYGEGSVRTCILESVNYLAGGNAGPNADTSAFQGRTFWDVIGNAGHKVCVINPIMAYSGWPVNGVMVNCPVFINGMIQASDPGLLKGIDIPKSMGGMADFPTKKP